MKQFYKVALTALIAAGYIFYFSGCLKRPLDSPPDTSGQNPDMKANTTISELKQMPRTGSLTGKIISGVITMDDKSGNYFKKLVIQDSTGGIEIEVDKTNLYADYPVGRRLFIKCDSLYLSEKNGIIQLGYWPDKNGYVRPIPAPLVNYSLFPGEFPVYIRPDTVSISKLAVPKDAAQYLNRIVALKNVEFVDTSMSVPFALPYDLSPSTSRVLEDCSGAVISLQTSGYASFQVLQTPAGKGVMTALYTCYNEKPQLVIRDTSDIHFDGLRCADLPSSGSVLSILQLRQLFSGVENNVTLGNFKIKGIVISDKNYKNTSAQSFILQGGTEDAGIVVKLHQVNTFSIGDSVLINVSDGKLNINFGSLTLENIDRSAIQLIAQQKSFSPETVTVSQLQTNPKSFDSRLVTVNGIHWTENPATINGNAGNLAFSDGTGIMNHFCEQGATFRNRTINKNTAASITGYVFIQNNQVFLKMRNPDSPENDLKE